MTYSETYAGREITCTVEPRGAGYAWACNIQGAADDFSLFGAMEGPVEEAAVMADAVQKARSAVDRRGG